MHRQDFKEIVINRRLELIKSVLIDKGTEYGADKSAFHNFEQATKLSFHATPQGVAWEFMCKHLQSIKDMIDDHQQLDKVPTTEFVEEKIGDAINYLILIEGMFKKKISEHAIKPEEVKLKYTLVNYDMDATNKKQILNKLVLKLVLEL